MANITGTAKKAKTAKGVVDKIEGLFNHKGKADKGATAGAAGATTPNGIPNAQNASTPNGVANAAGVTPVSQTSAADATKASAVNVPGAKPDAAATQKSPIDAAKDKLPENKDGQAKAADPKQPTTGTTDAAAEDSAAQPTQTTEQKPDSQAADADTTNTDTANTPDATAQQPDATPTADTPTPNAGATGAAAATPSAAATGGGAAAGGLKGKAEAAKQKAADTKAAAEKKVADTKAAAQAKVDNVKNAAQAKVDGVKNTVNGKVDAVKGKVGDVKGVVTDRVSGVTDKVKGGLDAVKNPGDTFKSALQTFSDQAPVAAIVASTIASQVAIVKGYTGFLNKLGGNQAQKAPYMDLTSKLQELASKKPKISEIPQNIEMKESSEKKGKRPKSPISVAKTRPDSKDGLHLDIPSWPKDKKTPFADLSVAYRGAINIPDCLTIGFRSKTTNAEFEKNRNSLFGEQVKVTFVKANDNGEQKTSHFNGVIYNIQHKEGEENKIDSGYLAFEVIVVPEFFLKLLSLRRKIYHDSKTCKEIIKKVFENAGFTKDDCDFDKLNSEIELEINDCFQGNQYEHGSETDFNFVMRLLGKYNISYYFTEEGKLIFVNDKNKYIPATEEEDLGTAFSTWQTNYNPLPNEITVVGHNFETPSTNQRKTQPVGNQKGNKNIVHFYAAGKSKKDVASAAATFANQHNSTGALVFARGSNSKALHNISVGRVFKITSERYFDDKKTRKFVCVALKVNFMSPDNVEYEIIAVPEGVYFNPSREWINNLLFSDERNVIQPIEQPKPREPEEAIVTGPKGEEIHTDPDGKGYVKIRYYWEQEDKKEGKSDKDKKDDSCWVRVDAATQLMFGIPKVGWNVLVNFINEEPIVMGVLYDGANNSPHNWKNNKHLRGVILHPGKNSGNGQKYHSEVISDDSNKPTIITNNPGDCIQKIAGDQDITVEKSSTQTAKEKVNINGGDVNVEGKKTAQIKAKQTTVEGDETTVKGKNTEVKGTASTNLGGGAITEVKGGVIKEG